MRSGTTPRETITNPEQLDAYLTDTGDWDEDVEEDLPNEPEPDELRATDSSQRGRASADTHEERARANSTARPRRPD